MDNDPRAVPSTEAQDDRLFRLSRASLHINESLEFDTVLQGVLDSARSQDAGQSAGTVLVVDDDPLILRSVRDALSNAGFWPVVTEDPEEALALMGEHSPRLALLDLMLPDHDGTELMADILAVSRIPVIFLSAYGRDEVVASVLEQGAVDYVVKPFSPTELSARIKAALHRRVTAEPSDPYVLDLIQVPVSSEVSEQSNLAVTKIRLLRLSRPARVCRSRGDSPKGGRTSNPVDRSLVRPTEVQPVTQIRTSQRKVRNTVHLGPLTCN